MKINMTPSGFEDWVKKFGDDFNVQWYGEYFGRCCHHGFAVRCDETNDVMGLIEQMNEFGWNLNQPNNQDHLGHGLIFSWDVDRFMEEYKIVNGSHGYVIQSRNASVELPNIYYETYEEAQDVLRDQTISPYVLTS